MSPDRLPTLFAIDVMPTSTSPDDLFEAWWRQYPRRVAKKAAAKAFKQVLAQKIASFDQLMAGAMRYAAERAGEDPTFTLHPATWLNGERWLDEPVAPVRRLSMANSMAEGILGAMGPNRRPTAADTAIEGMFSDLTPDDFLTRVRKP